MNEIKFSACQKMWFHHVALSDDLDRKEMQEHVYCWFDYYSLWHSHLPWCCWGMNRETCSGERFYSAKNMCQGTWYPVCTKWILQMTKVVLLVLKRSRSDHPSGRISRLLVFQRTFDKSSEYYMFCDQNDDIEKVDLNIDEKIVVVHSSSIKAYHGY